MVERQYLANLTGEPLRRQLMARPTEELVDIASVYITQWDAIRHAAHMPDDYKYGLASWINMELYACYIGASISPSIAKIIEDVVAARIFDLKLPSAPTDQIRAVLNKFYEKKSIDQKIEMLEEIMSLVDDELTEAREEKKHARP